MRCIRVKSLPIKQVIRDLAEYFDTQYTNNCDEYYLEIPNHIGNGFIKGVNFESGLGILQYDCVLKRNLGRHLQTIASILWKV